MCGQALEVVFDADTGGSSRVESGQTTVFERNFVVETNEFKQHVTD